MENENTSTALEVRDNDENYAIDLTARTSSYSSLVANTPEEKAALFNLMNNPEKRLSECINMTIEAKDVIIETVECINEKTGEVTKVPRTIIVDKNGVGYQCASFGVFNALKKIFAVFGAPTWETPLPLVVMQITSKEHKIMTLNIKTTANK